MTSHLCFVLHIVASVPGSKFDENFKELFGENSPVASSGFENFEEMRKII